MAWPVAGILILVMQAGSLLPVPSGIDDVSLAMALLAVLCMARTWQVVPQAGMAGRWRWQAAVIAWLLWAIQWIVNSVETVLLSGDQTIANILIPAHRAAFVAALLPLPSMRDLPILRWLDVAQGILFASLLAILSWPDLLTGTVAEPDRGFLYAGYAAMAAIAGVSMMAQPSKAMRGLAMALFWTLLGYGLTALVLRELFASGAIAIQSSLFIVGDAGFLIYLALLPDRATISGTATTTGTEVARRGSKDGNEGLSSLSENLAVLMRLVPLLLMTLVLALAFVVERRVPFMGVAIGLVTVAIHAVRTGLVERDYRLIQRTAIAREQERSRTMIDLMHEIRSPLGAVMLNAGLLSRSAALHGQDQGLCGAIASSCASISALLEDVLTLERLEAGLIVPAIAEHDVARIAADVASQLAERAADYGVTLIVPAGPFRVTIDRYAVQRILMNLVVNALRFTPRGGRVEVGFACERDSAPKIVVTDTGIGLTNDVRATLFDRFGHVGQPVHGNQGTGLGLSICLALARTMGGTIEATPTPGGGTTMTVFLSGQPRDYTQV